MDTPSTKTMDIKRPAKAPSDYVREHEIALLKLLIPKHIKVSVEVVQKIIIEKRK
jgi:hypothetical protein